MRRLKKLNKNNQRHLDELQSIDGIGNSQTVSLKKFFSNDKNLKIVSKLIDLLNVEDYKHLSKKNPNKRKINYVYGRF